MKKILSICAACAGVLVAVAACGQKANKVTAVVAGPEGQPVALVVAYDSPIAAASVTPESFAVPGKEVAKVFVTDKNPFEKCEAKEGECPKGAPQAQPGQPGPKPEGAPQAKPGEAPQAPAAAPKAPQCKGPESKDGQYVVVVLKEGVELLEPKQMGGPDAFSGASARKPEGFDPQGQPGEKPCCKEEGKPCDKPEAEQCDSCKAAKGPQPEGAPVPPQAKPGEGPKGPQAQGEKPEIAVPDVSVQQVADIQTAEGKTVKAWKKAVKASEAVPAPMHRGHHGHHGHPGCPKGQPGQPGQPAPQGAPQGQPGQPAPQQPKAE